MYSYTEDGPKCPIHQLMHRDLVIMSSDDDQIMIKTHKVL